MTDNWLSDCHQAPVKVVGADEGTNHWECTKCGKACNAHQTDNTIDHIHISKVGGTHCLECGQQLPQSTIDGEVRRSVWLIAVKARNIKADMNEITDELMATIAQEANKALGKAYVNLPIMDDLEHPLQQSWKLGGTDVESYKRGYSDASTKATQAIAAQLTADKEQA